jgi:hypothetical protein
VRVKHPRRRRVLRFLCHRLPLRVMFYSDINPAAVVAATR